MNEKGQAMLEAIVILSITMAGLFLLLKKGLQIPLDFYVDELVERVLICEYQNQNHCKSSLYQKLHKLRFQNIQIRGESSENKKTIFVSALSPFGFKLHKESTLKLKLTNL